MARVIRKKKKAAYRQGKVVLLETNVDDMNPQGFELLYERLFEAGALDVWVETILMKKMRPAFKLSVLLKPADQERIAETIFQETPTLGLRFLEMGRFYLPRKVVRLKTGWGSVRAKKAGDQTFPEYEDIKRIAKERKLPFRRVYEIIQKAVGR